jgi:hypothetical protein
MITELDEYGLEEFNKNYNTEFQNKQEATSFAKEQYENMEISEQYDLDDFIEIANNYGLLTSIMTEIYRNIIFPLWYQKWGAEGIDKVRENIEQIYKDLLNAKTLQQNLIAINLVVNATHMSGRMINYLEDPSYSETEIEDPEEEYSKSIGQTLDEISEGNYSDNWNKQLRDVGVEI